MSLHSTATLPPPARSPQPLTVLHEAPGPRDHWAAQCLWHPQDCSLQLQHRAAASENALSPFCRSTKPILCSTPMVPCLLPSMYPIPVAVSRAERWHVSVEGRPQACFLPFPGSSDGHGPFLGSGKQGSRSAAEGSSFLPAAQIPLGYYGADKERNSRQPFCCCGNSGCGRKSKMKGLSGFTAWGALL